MLLELFPFVILNNAMAFVYAYFLHFDLSLLLLTVTLQGVSNKHCLSSFFIFTEIDFRTAKNRHAQTYSHIKISPVSSHEVRSVLTFADQYTFNAKSVTKPYEPCLEKTCLWGFQYKPGCTATEDG